VFDSGNQTVVTGLAKARTLGSRSVTLFLDQLWRVKRPPGKVTQLSIPLHSIA